MKFLPFLKIIHNLLPSRLLKKKSKVTYVAIITIAFIIIPITFFTLFNPFKVQAAWFDDSFSYRQQFSITNNGSLQTNIQVQVPIDTATLISAGKMQTSCNDVRFTTLSGKVLPYFQELCSTTSGTNGLFWVTVDTLPASTSTQFYVYYGNPSAPATSSFTSNPTGISVGSGKDGSVTFAADTNINTANTISGRSCADGGDAVNYSVTSNVSSGNSSITLSSTPSSGCLAVNDEILIINLQGTSTNNSNVGKYEFARIVSISTATLTLNHNLINTYDGTTQKIMVQRVPNYTSATVNSTKNLTATAWNGTKGGVIAFRTSGTATITGNVVGTSLGFQTPSVTSSNFQLIESYKGTNTGTGTGVGGGNGSTGTNFGGAGGLGGSTGGFGIGGGVSTDRGGGGGGGAGGRIGGSTSDIVTTSTLSTLSLGYSPSNGGPGGAGGGGGLAGANGGGGGGGGAGGGGAGGEPGSDNLATAGSNGTSSTGGAGGNGGTSGATGGAGGGIGAAGSADSFGFASCGAGTAQPGQAPSNPQNRGGGIIIITGSTVSVGGTVISGAGAGGNGGNGGCGAVISQTGGGGGGGGGGKGGNAGAILINAGTATLGSSLVSATGGSGGTGGTLGTGGSGGSAGSNGATGDNGKIAVNSSTSSGSTNPSATSSTLPLAGALSNEEKTQGPIGYWKFDEGSGVFANNAGTQDITSNMAAYYKMDEGSWTGDCSTASVVDSSGNGNNAKACPNASAATITTSGKYMNAGSFDGTNDYLITSSNVLDPSTTDFTISAWFKTTSTTDTGIVSQQDGSGTGRTLLYQASSTISTNIAGSPVSGTTTISTGTWYMGTVTKSGTTVSVYLNGKLEGTGIRTAESATGSWVIGANKLLATNWAGNIDDLRVYKRALTPSQVSALYGATSEGTLLGTTKPSWQDSSQCISGKCLYFDGSTSYISGHSAPPLELTDTSSFSVGAWVKTNSTAATQQNIFSKQENVSGEFVYSLYITAGKKAELAIAKQNTGADVATGATTLSPNTWYYIIGTYDGTNLKIYVNGKQDGSGTKSVATSTTSDVANYYIGEQYNGALFFKGFIDDLKVYNYTRSSTQILNDYNSKAAAASKGSGSTLGVQDQSGLSNGLVGYYKMEEGTGTSTADSSGNGVSGTFYEGTTASTSGPTWAAGKYGWGTSYSGTNDVVRITESTPTDVGATTDSYSVGAWFKTSTNFSAQAVIVSKNNNGTSNYPYELFMDNTEIVCFDLARGGTAPSTCSPSTYNDGNWHQAIGVRDATKSKIYLYIDGVLVSSAADGTVAAGTTVNNADISIGNGGNSYNQYDFTGSIDEVRLYSRALQQNDITQLYQFSPGPVSYWNFEEGSGTTANDTSGNGNTGTLTNSPTWTTGKYGKSLQFNSASSQSVGAGSPSITDDMPSMTISAWVYETGNGGSSVGKILTKSSGTSGWTFGTDTGTNLVFFAGYSGAGGACGGGDLCVYRDVLTLNAWHHVAVTWSGSNLASSVKMYLDGKLLTAAADLSADGNGSRVTDASYNTTIGNVSTGGEGWTGKIDDVKVYNYERTAQQIVSDMNANHPTVGSPVVSSLESPAGYWKMDEGDSQTCELGAYDLCNSGSAGVDFDATFITGTLPLWTQSGKFNKALSFSGDDLFQGDIFADPPSTSFTLSAWIAGGANGESIVGIDSALGANTGFGFDAGGICGSNHYCFYVADNVTTYTASNVAAVNGWTHLVGVYDGSTIKLYQNGILQSTTTATYTPNGTTFGFGRNDSSTNKFIGYIDEVKLYNYALTPDQVLLDYNQGSSQVLGALSDNSNYAPQAGNQEYCVLGDSTTCTSPILRWDFEEGPYALETYDSSGTFNTGTLGGGSAAPTSVPGKIGKALSFDGSNDILTAPNSSSLQLTGDMTISMWVKPGSTQNTNADMLSKHSTGNAGYGIESNGTGNTYYFFWFTGGAATCTGTTFTLTANTWQHLEIVKSGATASYYINGINTGSCTGSGSTIGTGTDALYLGRWSSGGGRFWTGSIDNFKMFNYARSASQVAWDYNRGGPAAWWKFDECQGTSLNDSTGNGNTATITIGASGTSSAGTCTTASTAWGNGATGKFNSSLKFDGTDDSATLTSNSYINVTNPFTLSSWVKLGVTNTIQGIMSKYNFGVGATQYEIRYGNTTNKYDFFSDNYTGTNPSFTFNKTISDTNWHMITVTYDGTTIKGYIDGVLDSSSTKSFSLSGTGNFALGNDVNSKYLNGQLDDTRIYQYALTAKQVQDIYNLGAASFRPSTGTP